MSSAGQFPNLIAMLELKKNSVDCTSNYKVNTYIDLTKREGVPDLISSTQLTRALGKHVLLMLLNKFIQFAVLMARNTKSLSLQKS